MKIGHTKIAGLWRHLVCCVFLKVISWNDDFIHNLNIG